MSWRRTEVVGCVGREWSWCWLPLGVNARYGRPREAVCGRRTGYCSPSVSRRDRVVRVSRRAFVGVVCVRAGLEVEVRGVVSMLWVGTGVVDGWNEYVHIPSMDNKPAA